MDHSDIDHDNFKSAYLKVLGINNDQEESIDEARLVTKDGKFIVMTDNDTEAATFEDRESALEYIKNNKEKLSVRDEKTKVTTDKVEAKEGKEVFIVPEEMLIQKKEMLSWVLLPPLTKQVSLILTLVVKSIKLR